MKKNQSDNLAKPAAPSASGITPGPWSVGCAGAKCWVNGPDETGAERVADCGPDEPDMVGWVAQAEQTANARAIAALPELVAALRGLLPWAQAYTTRSGVESSSRRADVEIARAVLARMDGKGGV
jgi:hypothetical protein